MKGNIKMDYKMGWGYGFQGMDRDMKENGESKKDMGLVYGLMDKENLMKEIGNRVNIMEKVFIK